jgi:iron complex transport system substrate-binding protein
LLFLLSLLLLLAAIPAARAEVAVVDDAGLPLRLQIPARRIVSLAPHTTEMLFAIGAGSSVVGAIDYSDFPPQARSLPSVGSAAYFDVERIVALRPQLVVAWGSGNNPARVQQLRAMGIPVFTSEPRDFEAIASNMERLGVLTGVAQAARGAAEQYRQQVRDLQARYANRPPVRVFYQIWDAPLMTLNDAHLLSHALALCGGVNIFGTLGQLAPTVGIEDVLQLNPEVIILASGRDESRAIRMWQRFAQMTAARRGNLVSVTPDWLTRPSPRIVQGTEAICRALDVARSRR